MKFTKAFKVSLLYAVTGVCWILFSDALADAFLGDTPNLLLWAHTLKGWGFIAVTTALLYNAFHRHERASHAQMSALEQSEARYRTVLENTSDVYYRTDSEGRLAMVSPSALPLLGYASMDELLGRPNASFWLHPEERRNFEERLRTEGRVLDFEVTLTRKDGLPVVVSTSSRLLRDAVTGKPYVEGLFRDITARKHAELTLRDSEERLRVIFNTSPSGIFQVNTEGVIVLANQRMAQLFHTPLEQLLGKPYTGLVHPAQRSVGNANMLALLRGELDIVTLERLYARADGSDFWGHLAGRRLTTDDGRYLGLLGIITDITERKRVEAELAHSHRLITNIIDALPVAVVGAQGDGRITHFNRAALALSGLTAEALTGAQVLEALPMLPIGAEGFKRLCAGKNPLVIDRHLPSASVASQRLFDIRAYPLGEGGADHVVVIIDDVTERTRLEEVMVQTEKMMSVGGLAAGMAHEINNPLGGIVQGMQVVQRRLDPALPANQEAAQLAGISLEALQNYMDRRDIAVMLQGVRDSAVRAAEIVSGMLEFSRKSDTSQTPVDVNALLDKAVELSSKDYDLKKRYDFRKIEIVTEYDPSLPLVTCSSMQLEQVFLNLLRNAAQAMRGGETAHPRITLRTRLEGVMAHIEVQDNGPGIPEDIRRRVFEPFFSTKPPGEGTGLGLSVSYFIVTSNHKGVMEVESSPGHGASFVIRLPLLPGASAT